MSAIRSLWGVELTLKDHSLFDALFETAILAAVPLGFRDLTGPVGDARVNAAILHGSFEEAFASVRGELTGMC